MILAVCDEVRQMCCNLEPFLKVIKILITILQFSVPLILIVLGTLDMFKAVASGDEKVAGEVRKTFINRLIYAVLIFLVPAIIELVLEFVENDLIQDDSGLTSATSWVSCWTNINDDDNDAFCSPCNDIYSGSTNTGSTGNTGTGSTGNSSETKSCYLYLLNNTRKGADVLPSATQDGIVDVYTCESSIKCSSVSLVESKCAVSGSVSVDKTSDSSTSGSETSFICYQFDYCESGYYCNGKCYSSTSSAKSSSECRRVSGKSCWNSSASLCVTDGALNKFYDVSTKYSASSVAPDEKKYSGAKKVTCNVTCDKANANSCH